MNSAISKRQQARNERALQDLLRNVPGNDRCADCAANNPGWSSWSLGIFVCMRCAALHRKLGTHISKVKSLSMDSWTVDQVENMRKIGNVTSNKIFNPQNVRPEISSEVDEVDAALEKFIRQKYEQRAFMNGAAARRTISQHTGSTGTASWTDDQPDLPAKPQKKFGFSLRSSSSTSARAKMDHPTPPLSPDDKAIPNMYRSSKPSQMFGVKISGRGNDFDAKLTVLRDMGFSDARRSSEVLKSMNGDLDRAVETLVRLGEKDKPLPRSPTLSKRASPSPPPRHVNRIAVDKKRTLEHQSSTHDPWEIKASPQRALTLPTQPMVAPQMQPTVQSSMAWNPFLVQNQQPQTIQGLDQAFQSMQVADPWSNPQPIPSIQQNAQYAAPLTVQTTASPPAPNNPFYPPVPINQQPLSASNTGQYVQNQSLSPMPDTSSNPFLRSSRSYSQLSTNPWASSSSSGFSPVNAAPFSGTVPTPWAPQSQHGQYTQSPFAQSPINTPGAEHPSSGQPTQQMGQSYFHGVANPAPTNMGSQTAASASTTFSPSPWAAAQQQPPTNQGFMQQSMPAASNQPLQYSTTPQSYNPSIPQSYSQHTLPTPGSRIDKNSILSLYNTPNSNFRPLQSLPEDPNHAAAQFAVQQPQYSNTIPPQPLQSMNPFAASAIASQPAGGPRHVSNESMAFVGLGGGRHSPDAFAGLSAHYTRS